MYRPVTHTLPHAERRKVVAYTLTCLIAAAIALLTLTPAVEPPPGPDGADKAYHFIAFAGLVLPIALLRPQALVWMIPTALLYGAGIEVIQPFVNRSRDLSDFFADAAGILAGSAFGVALYRFTLQRPSRIAARAKSRFQGRHCGPPNQ
jgi:hypothetical protein